MRKFLKRLAIGLPIAIVLIVSAAGAYLKLALPNVGKATDLKVESTPERIERGKYLAYHVTLCMDCHSTRDWSKFAAPLVAGTDGQGGERFDQSMGFPGAYYSPNITPYNLKNWTDGEIYRAITAGVNKKGKALFPVMPYHYYGLMADEDIHAIIAFLRTLKEIPNTPQASASDFPMSFIINTIPRKGKPQPIPPTSNSIAYGKYITNAAACLECHTPREKGMPVMKYAFSGGSKFPFPQGILRSPNITFDKNTGIGNWSREQFISRFTAYADSTYKAPPVAEVGYPTVMPWTMYAGMKPEDLGAIYDYLASLPPIPAKVERFTPIASK